MATVEFQMSTPAFLKAQRNTLLHRFTCPPGPFAIMGADGSPLATIVLDRIDFGASSLAHDQAEEFDVFGEGSGSLSTEIRGMGKAKGFLVQMKQDVTVNVTTLEDIVANVDGEPSTVVPVTGTLVFEITAFPGPDGLIYMRIAFQAKDSTITPPANAAGLPVPWDDITKAVMAEIGNRLPAATMPIDLKELAEASKFINAGASVDTSLSRIAIRGDTALDVGNTPVGLWAEFYKGNFADRLGGNEWALFIDGKFMGSIIDAKATSGLSDLPDELEVIPRATYSNAGGKAVFNLDLNILIDAPEPAETVLETFPGLAGSGHVEIRIPIEIQLGSPTDLVVDADVSTVQQQATEFLGLAGDIVDFLGISLQGFIDAGALSALSGFGDEKEKCEITPAHHIRCSKTVRAPNTGGMSLGIVALLPLQDGFSLAGNLRMATLTAAVLDLGTRQIQLQPPSIDCSTAGISTIAAFSTDPSGWEILHGGISIINQGTAPLTLCDYQVIGNDWAGAFPRTGLRPDGTVAPINMIARFAKPNDLYYQGDGPGRPPNYPCIVLVRTSAGTRAVSLGNAPPVSVDDLKNLKAQLLVKVGDCQILTDNWWDGDHAHIPEWHIPDPPDLRPGHHWQFDVEGLRAGEAAAILDRDGNQIVSVIARNSAAVHLSTVVQPVPGRRDLSLAKIAASAVQRGGGVGAASVSSMMAAEADKEGKVVSDEPPSRGISTFQQSLIPIGSVRLESPCVDVVASHRAGKRMFVAVTSDSLAAYDLANPLQPTMIGRWAFDGARGAVPWQGGVLAFGDDGLAMVDGRGMSRIDGGRCDAFHVHSAAAAGDWLFAVTDDGIECLDGRLRRLWKVEMKSGRKPRSIVAAGRCMALGCLDGIMTMPKDGRPDAKRLETRQKLRVRRLSKPPMRLLGPGVLAELEDGSARLLEVDDHRVEDVMWFAKTPWFAHVAWLGNVLAHRVTDAKRLEFYRLGPFDRR
jgi:hypothetical protein